MPATMYGPDLGEAYRTAAAVKGQRLQNRLTENKLGQMEGAKNRNMLMQGARQKAAGGDQDARRALAVLDPEGSAKFFDAMSKADAPQIEKMKQSADEMGKMSAFVLQGKDPQEQARRYQMVRQNMPPASQQGMPEQYDPEFMEQSLAKASSMDQLLQNPKVSQVGGEDVVYKGGREIERKARPVKTGEAGSGGLKTADESLIGKFVEKLFGGFYDPITKEFSGLSEDNAQKAASIASEAVRIYTKGKGKISRRDAANRAARKAGVKIKNLEGGIDINRVTENANKLMLKNQGK